MYCPQCGTQNADRNRFCSNCGGSIAGQAPTVVAMPQQPAGVPSPIPYGSAPGTLRRAGSLLVATPGAQFPPYCVKCGQPAQKWLTKNFSWHTPWVYAIILINLIIYVIVAAIVSKRMRLSVPLCAQHYGRRRMWLTLGWSLLAGCILVPIMIGVAGDGSDEAVGVAVLVGLGMFIASLVFLVIGSMLVRVQEITATETIFSGISPAFLQYVPEGPGQGQAPLGIGAAQMR